MKNSWSWLGIILLIAILGFGGYYFFQQNNEPKNMGNNLVLDQGNSTQNQISNNLSNSLPSTNNTVGDTDSNNINTDTYLTYTNEAYGFSIQYPKNWFWDATYAGNLFLTSPGRQKDVDAGKMVRVCDICLKAYKLSAELPNNQDSKSSFEDWISQLSGNYGFINREPITIDGVSGYQGLGVGDGESYLVFVKNDNFIYEISTGDTNTPTKIEQTIIDSIKFQ